MRKYLNRCWRFFQVVGMSAIYGHVKSQRGWIELEADENGNLKVVLPQGSSYIPSNPIEGAHKVTNLYVEIIDGVPKLHVEYEV